MDWRPRIVIDPQILAGKPIVKGTRISVEHVLRALSDGWGEAGVLRAYPHLTAEDIQACLAYAAQTLASERVYPLSA
jgi:uncharacterized protein (DUF433 family)